ncbi:hypothetical protein C5D65_00845 [Rathayibacter toxicus]|nr:hypothetical protein APU90_05415 [Rathayibacter toxicus]PPH89376.1 hypothetical protein C5D31_00860 [Rathayibacter toxicus]PPI33938.1 hypothetical protein C5D65_00845 [Rathayibacter toxicus]
MQSCGAAYQLSVGLADVVFGVGALSPSAMAAELSAPHSSPTAVGNIPNVDQAMMDSALASLPGSALPRSSRREGNKTVTSYQIGGGLTITTVELDASSTVPAIAASLLSGGWDVGGPYVDLNRADQAIVASGGAAGLSVALCAVPGVGVPLCASTSAILTAAAAFIATNGACGDSMRIHLQQFGYPECVS